MRTSSGCASRASGQPPTPRETKWREQARWIALPGKPAPPKTPFETAVAMLSRRPYSVAELRRALERKFPDSADLPQVLVRLRQLGYLDDAKFAEAYASSLARVRNYGRHRVRRELKSKLVDYRVIDRAVDNAFTSVNERELLERALDKKIRTLRKPVTRSEEHTSELQSHVNLVCRL